MTHDTPQPYCLECHEQVTWAQVRLYDRNPANGEVVLSWNCGCGVVTYKGRMDERLLAKLLGAFRPAMPYTAAPLPSVRLSRGLELMLRHASILLMDVETPDDFLSLCVPDERCGF